MIAIASLLLASGTVPLPLVAVLVRPIERGELLSVGDFEQQPRATGAAVGAVSATAAAGRETTRALPAGAIVRAGDTVTPRMVRRGEPVAITLRSRGLTIATMGRALSTGGLGDLVLVVASATNRTFDATVEGSSAVRLMLP